MADPRRAVPPGRAAMMLGISIQLLTQWTKQGRVPCYRPDPRAHRRYWLHDVYALRKTMEQERADSGPVDPKRYNYEQLVAAARARIQKAQEEYDLARLQLERLVGRKINAHIVGAGMHLKHISELTGMSTNTLRAHSKRGLLTHHARETNNKGARLYSYAEVRAYLVKHGHSTVRLDALWQEAEQIATSMAPVPELGRQSTPARSMRAGMA